MDKLVVIHRLMELPAEIAQAESNVIDAQNEVRIIKDELADLEANLLLGQVPDIKIDGKNAEQRTAQMRQATAKIRMEVVEAESTLANHKYVLNKLLNEFKAYRAVARILDDKEAV